MGTNKVVKKLYFHSVALIFVAILFLISHSVVIGADHGTITSGETKSDNAISDPSSLDTWTFEGTQGDRVIINTVRTSGDLDTRIILYSPGSGAAEASTNWYCSSTSCGYPDQLDWQLRHTGTYTIVVEDGGLANSGTYNISFLKTPGPVNSAADPDGGSITSGQTLGGTINVASDMDAFQFYGNSDDRVIINTVRTSGDLDTRIILYSPGSGAAEASTNWYCSSTSCGYPDKLDWQLRHTGTYTIVVEDGGLANSGTYNISFLKTPGPVNTAADPDGGSITSGQTLGGTINVASDMDAFQFYGNSDDRVIINTVRTSGDLDTSVQVYPPGGGAAEAASAWYCSLTSCGWTDDLDWQLQKTGLYTIVVEDGGLANSGKYNISLTKTPSDALPGIYNPSPQNGSTVSNPDGSFSWDSVAGATGYDLYLGADMTAPLEQVGFNLPSPSTPFPTMQLGERYYWHVVAHIPAARPICINSHVINDVPYYASVWIYNPTTVWRASHNQPSSEYQQTFDQLSARGYRPIDIDTHVIENIPYYSSVWVYDPTILWAAFHGQTASEYQSAFDQEVSNGYRLTSVDTHVINDVPYYSSVWVYDPTTLWAAFHGQTASEYQSTFDQEVSNGYRLTSVDTHVINDVPYYASVWVHDTTTLWVTFRGQTASEYQSIFDQEVSNGYRLLSVDTHVINDVPYYASVWVKNDGASWAARHGQPFCDYQQTFDQWAGYVDGPYWWFYYESPALYATFTGSGLYKWNGSTWTQLTPYEPTAMAATGSLLYGKYSNGIWQYNGSAWTQLTPYSPEAMVAAGSLLYGKYPNGIWQYNGSTWSQLTPYSPTAMAATGSLLYGKYDNGIWQYNGSAWTQLTPYSPEAMVAAGSLLYGKYDNGIWQYNGSAWTQLIPYSPTAMVAAGSLLYGKYDNGIWQYNGSTWTQLTPSIPEAMVAAGSLLYGDFGSTGIWMYNGSTWTQITPNDPASMTGN